MYQKISGVYTGLTERYPKYLGRFFALIFTMTAAWALYSARQVESLDTGNLLYFRGLINMSIALYMAQLSGTPLFPTGKLEITILLIRMCVCSCTINLRTLGVKIAPLQQYAVITRTDSLMTLLVSTLFFGEVFNKWIGIAAILSFTGLLLVINPAIFGLGIPIEDSNPDQQLSLIAGVVLVVSAIGDVGNKIFIGKNVKLITETHNLLWSGFSITLSGSVLNMVFGEGFKYPEIGEIGWVLSMGIFSALLQ